MTNNAWKNFLKENFDIISLIQQAYISSRYLPTEYIKEHAERALSLVDKFKETIVQCLSS
ncbi:HEPN domain-containing protein [Sulfolobus tengchongensis]|uniref:HEPN domain-containing protein n=1 Tax=Sulfolobus tengchongensis TaxID=207809 RepID=UPI003BAE42D1